MIIIYFIMIIIIIIIIIITIIIYYLLLLFSLLLLFYDYYYIYIYFTIYQLKLPFWRHTICGETIFDGLRNALRRRGRELTASSSGSCRR